MTTERTTVSGGQSTVQCSSSHLTSFAVLVDVRGVKVGNKEHLSEANFCVYLHCRLILRHSLLCHTLVYQYPLFVSYSLSSSSLVFGKSNSVHSLNVMYVNMHNYRKKLFTAVHNFVHLNLAISLLAGYLVFALGVELATSNKVCQSIFQYPVTILS